MYRSINKKNIEMLDKNNMEKHREIADNTGKITMENNSNGKITMGNN